MKHDSFDMKHGVEYSIFNGKLSWMNILVRRSRSSSVV